MPYTLRSKRSGRARDMKRTTPVAVWLVAFLSLGSAALHAVDWPEVRGKGRLGVWNETGILEKVPEGGLVVGWRTPIRAGSSGPAVADGRVFVSDFSVVRGMRGTE